MTEYSHIQHNVPKECECVWVSFPTGHSKLEFLKCINPDCTFKGFFLDARVKREYNESSG